MQLTKQRFPCINGCLEQIDHYIVDAIENESLQCSQHYGTKGHFSLCINVCIFHRNVTAPSFSTLPFCDFLMLLAHLCCIRGAESQIWTRGHIQ